MDSISFFSFRADLQGDVLFLQLGFADRAQVLAAVAGIDADRLDGLGLAGRPAWRLSFGRRRGFFRQRRWRRGRTAAVGAGSALADLARSKTTRKGFSRTKFLRTVAIALEVDGEQRCRLPWFSLGHPLQQLRILHRRAPALRNSALAGQDSRFPARPGRFSHRVGESAGRLRRRCGCILRGRRSGNRSREQVRSRAATRMATENMPAFMHVFHGADRKASGGGGNRTRVQSRVH